jgi:hypothetical protein
VAQSSLPGTPSGTPEAVDGNAELAPSVDLPKGISRASLAVAPPPLFQLGTGPGSFHAYKAEFNRLYRSGPITDALGREVLFSGDSAHHVCFKPDGDDPYFRKPRTVWAQERAERISWISRVLTNPYEIRPNHQVPHRRQGYFLMFPASAGRPEELYYAVVDIGGDPNRVQFLTAYPTDRKYWSKARQGGACLYPLDRSKKGKSK